MSCVAEKKATAKPSAAATVRARSSSGPPPARQAKAASPRKVAASASWASMIQLRRRPGHGSAYRSTSGDQRNFRVQAMETPDRSASLAFGTPWPMRKNWNAV
jgi:hypothetical protein